MVDWKDKLQQFKNTANIHEVRDEFIKNFDTLFINKREEIRALVEDDFEKWLYRTRKSNSPRIFSRKRKIAIEATDYTIHLPNNKSYIFYKVVFVSKKYHQFQVVVVNYISTKRGMLYFKYEPSNNDEEKEIRVQAFYSHLFDRVSERLYDNEMGRVEAICNHIYTATNQVMILNKKNMEMTTYNPSGLTLGYFCEYKIDDKDYLFTVHHTFINGESMHEGQRKLFTNFLNGELEENYQVIVDGM